MFYDDDLTAVIGSELYGRFGYGMEMGRSGKLEFDIGVGRISNRFFNGMKIASLKRDRGTYIPGQIRVNYQYSTFNSTRYATQGRYVKATALGVYGRYSFFPGNERKLEQKSDKGLLQFEFNYEKYWNVSKKWVIGLEGNFVAASGKFGKDYGKHHHDGAGFPSHAFDIQFIYYGFKSAAVCDDRASSRYIISVRCFSSGASFTDLCHGGD